MSQRLAWRSLKLRLLPNRFFDSDFDFLLRVSNLPTPLLSGTPKHPRYFMESLLWSGIPAFPCAGETWPSASRSRLSVAQAAAHTPAPCPAVPLAPFPAEQGHPWAIPTPTCRPRPSLSSLASPQGLLNETLIRLSQVVFFFF